MGCLTLLPGDPRGCRSVRPMSGITGSQQRWVVCDRTVRKSSSASGGTHSSSRMWVDMREAMRRVVERSTAASTIPWGPVSRPNARQRGLTLWTSGPARLPAGSAETVLLGRRMWGVCVDPIEIPTLEETLCDTDRRQLRDLIGDPRDALRAHELRTGTNPPRNGGTLPSRAVHSC
jgi:hypothetical protein